MAKQKAPLARGSNQNRQQQNSSTKYHKDQGYLAITYQFLDDLSPENKAIVFVVVLALVLIFGSNEFINFLTKIEWKNLFNSL